MKRDEYTARAGSCSAKYLEANGFEVVRVVMVKYAAGYAPENLYRRKARWAK